MGWTSADFDGDYCPAEVASKIVASTLAFTLWLSARFRSGLVLGGVLVAASKQPVATYSVLWSAAI